MKLVIYSNYLKKVLKIGEMLIMLIMLVMGGGLSKSADDYTMISMINISWVLSTFLDKVD